MKKTVLVVSLIMILTLGLVGCGEDKTESSAVATDGSTSMEKVIGTLGESFQKENEGIKFSYNATGSSSGISAVLEDRCDIGLSSRVLSDDEKAKGLKETVLAYDGIAIIVNPNNSVQDLTLEQISKIYTGEINNWNQLGGDDKEIVVIGREAGSGTRDGFESITETEDKSNADAKSIELKVLGGGKVFAVKPLIHEILYNLIDNSIRYTRNGGTITIKTDDNYIEITDNGIGIPKDSLPRIFERFYRVDKSHSKESGGTGLGLSIVKNAVQYLGGTITAESIENQGSTFKIHFNNK